MSAAVAWPVLRAGPRLPAGSGALVGVAAVSARDVWAVGSTGFVAGRPLIERWDGRSWRRFPVPGLPRIGSLTSVAAVSARDAWAVGSAGAGAGRPLIARWNGTAWRRVPVSLRSVSLYNVAAVAGRAAWAAGCSQGRPAILRWDGRSWTRMPIRSLRAAGCFDAVAAVSARTCGRSATSA